MRQLITKRPSNTRLVAAVLLVAMGLSLLPMTGCAIIHRGRVCVPLASIVYVATAPPALIVETRPPRPAGVAIWIDGYWSWDGHAYVWIPGFWDRHPRSSHWVPGHWRSRHRGWVWVPGYWR